MRIYIPKLFAILIVLGLTSTCGRLRHASTGTFAVHQTSQDSLIPLRQRVPADSVVLRQGGATILLSMRDVEEYYARWPLSPDVERFRDEMRRAYVNDGWVQLGEGMLEDILAAQLIGRGHAAVRMGPRQRLIPFVTTELERTETNGATVRHRLFYTPDGALLLRVFDGTTVS